MRICVFEDAGVKNLHPLTLTRPAFDLRCGSVSLLERLERCLPERVSLALVRSELADLCRVNHPHLQVWESAIREDTDERELVLLVNARWLAPAERLVLPDGPVLGCIGEQAAYAVVPASELRGLSLTNVLWRLAEWRQKLPQSSRRRTDDRLSVGSDRAKRPSSRRRLSPLVERRRSGSA